jgi:hypothetical protein
LTIVPAWSGLRADALLELGDAFHSRHFRIARHRVRLAEEKEKPNEKRLREYRESALDSLRLQLFSPAPIYPELERVKLAITARVASSSAQVRRSLPS